MSILVKTTLASLRSSVVVVLWRSEAMVGCSQLGSLSMGVDSPYIEHQTSVFTSQKTSGCNVYKKQPSHSDSQGIHIYRELWGWFIEEDIPMGKIDKLPTKLLLNVHKRGNQVWVIRKVRAAASIKHHHSLTKITDVIYFLFPVIYSLKEKLDLWGRQLYNTREIYMEMLPPVFPHRDQTRWTRCG